MGLWSEMKKAVEDYSVRHKEHMMQQWDKQAKRAESKQAPSLTETQLKWQQLAQEAQQAQAVGPQTAPQQARAPMPAAAYSITCKVRLTSTSVIPMPWMHS